MRIAIDWIKSNLISVVSIIVVLLSLAFVLWMPQMKGKGELRDQMKQRAGKIDTFNGLINATIQLPPSQPDAPPETVAGATVNQDVIDKLQTLYNGLERQYNGVFESAVEFNRRGHVPILDGLFPRWNPANPDIPFLAREEYLRAFDEMFRGHDSENPDAPRLDAGMPPSREQLQLTMEQVARDFVAADVTNVQLTPAEEELRQKVMREKLIDELRLRAEQIHIYAMRDTMAGPGGMSRGYGGGQVYRGPSGPYGSTEVSVPTVYPFQVAAWAYTNVSPQPAQLWEGQLELWIQQDIVRAIGRANRVDLPTSEANVITAPVKRLVQMQVVPGYVGLHTVGAAQNGTFNPVQQRPDGAYPNPVGGQRTNDPDAKVSDNFYVGPTGRVSNALYDVRHAVVDIVVDYTQLPALINTFSEVNFMTVLNVQVQDIDEYLALREGYMYGSDDVVLARLVVETIWLRDWTQPLMPDTVRAYVGIDEPLAGSDAGGFGMPGGYGMPGDFGMPGEEYMY